MSPVLPVPGGIASAAAACIHCSGQICVAKTTLTPAYYRAGRQRSYYSAWCHRVPLAELTSTDTMHTPEHPIFREEIRCDAMVLLQVSVINRSHAILGLIDSNLARL